MVLIHDVQNGSLADRHGIKRGDYLIRINGKDINDVLDYRYYITEPKVRLLIHRGPDLLDITVRKPRYSDIGLEFETFLMDEKRSCRNKCIFCFIDQLPEGMRKPLYFKDDDSRLSFLMGNYITLTNMDEHDIQRIIQMKMSPINISVHTTNPELRCQMLSNRFAGSCFDTMKRFAEAGIEMHGQIVLCKGVNDGKELMRSLGIIEIADNDINEVSGGQLQRACICRSMINAPKMIFADEPTGALNRQSSNEVMEELCKINTDGTTVMLVTHDAKVAAKCSRVIYIVDGNIQGEYNLSEKDERTRERALNNWLMEQGW
jgi:ABC-type dipeptide/oligopeptide/nickel transport system ATPase component